MTDMGVTCQKKNSYTVPASSTSCESDQVSSDDDLCYNECNSDFTGDGPVCWEDCPTGMYDCGALCTEDSSECTEEVLGMVKSVVGMVSTVASAATGDIDIKGILEGAKNIDDEFNHEVCSS